MPAPTLTNNGDAFGVARANNNRGLQEQMYKEDNNAWIGCDRSGNTRGLNSLDVQSFRVSSTSVASGDYSITMGQSCRASDSYAVAMGAYCDATGNSSLAMGALCFATGGGSTAMGYYCSALAPSSVAMGLYVKTNVSDTMESGLWGYDTRKSSARFNQDGQVALTIVDSATAPTDGGAAVGSEANGTLMRDAFAIQRNGNAITLFVNDGGTIKSLALGSVA